MAAPHYTVVVIGTGFGGTMTALPLARQFQQWNAQHPQAKRTVLMLERGTWWTTPVSTVQDKDVATYDFLRATKRQPVQHWSPQNHFRGFIDLITRCRRHRGNEDGLFDLTQPGRTILGGLLRVANDGVTVLRASGVGGGSLVYSNITIRPPELIFRDDRWRGVWTLAERDEYYDLARRAIGLGVLHALDLRNGKPQPVAPTNTGLSNIVARTARLDPHWVVDPDPLNAARGRKRIDLTRTPPAQDAQNSLWIDRARLFQTALSDLAKRGQADEYGAVDLAINDFDTANPNNQFDAMGSAKNYCERQGRCNVGCLPGARHTLNKQLMTAILGGPAPAGAPPKPPVFQNSELELWPLVEVEVVVKRAEGGYEIRFVRHDVDAYLRGKRRRRRDSVTADCVIVAAGCLGTSEIMLRSRDRKTIPGLSPMVGFGFSTNGDYIAFMEKTRQRVSLTRGPVTTSFGHFNTKTDDPAQDRVGEARFHTLEDQGIPPSLASLAGIGLPLIRSLSRGRHHLLFLLLAIVRFAVRLAWQRVKDIWAALFRDPFKRPATFQSEEEVTARMMCVVAMGREAAIGRFRLGKGPGATPLRVRRDDQKPFWKDSVYDNIQRSLERLAPAFQDPADPKPFFNPFLTKNVFGVLKVRSIPLTHPLGGCRIAEDGTRGVVDSYGRVFDMSTPASSGVHKGLYIMDGSIIPTALGVNPSLTISALALRAANQIITECGAQAP